MSRVQLPDLRNGDVRGDPGRTRRGLPCGSSDAAHCIELHWRGREQANLVPTDPGKWAGPCPVCGRFRELRVKTGDNGTVIWALAGKCGHTREHAYPKLQHRVPCAPGPRHQPSPEAEAVKNAMVAILTNKTFTPTALRLAGLEALGVDQDQALDMLGITASSNRRRARLERDKGLSRAATIETDSKRRSKSPKVRSDNITPDLPAKTRLPAATIETDSPPAIETDSPPRSPKPPLTSTFPDLTDRATLVSGPAGWIRNTDTDLTEALELLRTELGAQVIATEPGPGRPVADTIEAWTAADEGPCLKCGRPTCLYGPNGRPVCADCRTNVRRPA